MSDILDQLVQESVNIQSEQSNARQSQINSIKNLIKEKAESVNRLSRLIELAEVNLKELQKDHQEKLDEIRQVWSPFLAGVDKSELDLGDLKVTMNNKLNIKADDQDAINSWLLQNGFESCMKYQIHNQTFKRIARELKENPTCPVEIPGAVYSQFQIIEVKPNRKG